MLVYKGIFNTSEHRTFESAQRFQFACFSNWIAVRILMWCTFSLWHMLCLSFIYRKGFGELPLLLFHNSIFDLGALDFFDSWCKTFHSLNSKLQQGSVKPNRGQECQFSCLCYSHRPLNVWALLFRRIVSLVGAQHLSKLTSACEKARRSRLDGTRTGPRVKSRDSPDKTF